MKTAKEFFLFDFSSTLFPMETCKVLFENGEPLLEAYVQRCLSKKPADAAYQFLAQTRVYASKPRGHLRRTVKLDPVAEYFLYTVIFRNKLKFRKPFGADKKHFGYRFEKSEPLTATASYSGFKKALVAYSSKFKHSISFDVASYFNGIYHHDIVSWFANAGASIDDVNALGTYMRQSNSGRSIDCWPQGMYPAKMVGNDFLRFVEQHHGLKAKAVVRFMDDFVLYSDNQQDLSEDFYLVQKLLGQKGLSVNPSKTTVKGVAGVEVEDQVDGVKAGLLQKRRKAAILAYLDDLDAAVDAIQMSADEIKYIKGMLKADHLEEEDAELILSLFRDHTEEVLPYIGQFAISFPHLAKSIWSFSHHIKDKEFVADFVLKAAKFDGLQEYQLFWFAWILQDSLMGSTKAAEIVDALYNHKNSTTISKAKILEIADNRFGLTELRDEHLVAGRSDWLAWASAVGHRNLPPISRNHKLEYFANSSPMNKLIKDIIA
ncbi:antiviral reverse transcriptase Drt5 [Sulfitobacter donghicola]|uniref:RNA-directed DNA polymerase n=1 Tax=Sulfitobacter donghicola DSW-25 = KCTC 12864 = JCM 14565 TaxID=1300350 RepID=A0A073IE06_9RHOB|nr:antiviral reverse transcriptase Drt5 [Sulfitobacter donghicola]KEJ87964.1 RNA-directed DNA polymerase [Sulfitobacter donghicola DSW-25 = KCTC 12864 = JCM 14565]KIN69472.1 Orotate phosphoribosyltransferase [Sulfitobacter donghicola DSW-25 = KCTC 12864 = JCM 14565]